jgi:hypothetical protein
MCSVDSLGYMTSSQGIRGYTFVMATLKFDVLLKIIAKWLYVYSVQPLEYLIKKPPVPTKQAMIILIKVKSCNALLHVLLVCVCNYLKSVLQSKLLYIYMGKDMRIFQSHSGSANKKVWETLQ